MSEPGAGGVLSVSGGASADEVAAVLAAMTRRHAPEEFDGYPRWRSVRLAALARRGNSSGHGVDPPRARS